MKEMKIKKELIPIIFILFVNCLLFFKIFLYGLFPVPGDLLVSFYFPWYSGQWQGYDPWTTRKELISADAVRQIYIWKDFAASSFKSAQFPLWNPYTFSGQPLLANVQSSVFYPLNLFYFLFDSRVAWILLIVIQPVLAGIFCYYFCKSLKISTVASTFSATVFIFSSYLITWLENGNIIHSYIFLPLSLLACQLFFINKKVRYVILGILSLSLSVFAGHPQTAIYIYITFTAFWLYKWFWQDRKRENLYILAIILLTSLAFCAVQLFPSYSLYKKSPVSLPFSKNVFEEFLIPYQNLVTFLVPDFFGHPATNNFWSRNYGDFNPYIGVIPLIIAIYGIFKNYSNKFVKFALGLGALFFLASLQSPVSYLVKTFQIPILDSTSSARFMSVTIFMLIVLSGFGLDSIIHNIKKGSTSVKGIIKFVLCFGFIYLFLWVLSSFFRFLPVSTEIVKNNFKVTQRNLLLPSFLYLSFLISVSVWLFLPHVKNLKFIYPKLFVVIIFVLTIGGGVYFSNKYLPSAPVKFIFPQHKIFTYLQENAGINRIEGFDTASIDRNFPAVYHLYTPEGYDTLRFARYAELIAASDTGSAPQVYSRSDATLPTKENEYRMRIMDLLGVKYIVDKEDNPKTGKDWHYERFTPDKLHGIWQNGRFQVYERETVLPRYFLTNDYLVEKNDKEIIKKIYNKSYPLKKVILEQFPTLQINSNEKLTYDIHLEKYDSNEVVFKVKTSGNAILFLSDSFDSDWQVFVNGKKSKILRADYALRAVEIPKGTARVRFVYTPKSFTVGLTVTMVTIVGLIISAGIAYKKKSF
jgi:hypothetical protein